MTRETPVEDSHRIQVASLKNSNPETVASTKGRGLNGSEHPQKISIEN